MFCLEEALLRREDKSQAKKRNKGASRAVLLDPRCWVFLFLRVMRGVQCYHEWIGEGGRKQTHVCFWGQKAAGPCVAGQEHAGHLAELPPAWAGRGGRGLVRSIWRPS